MKIVTATTNTLLLTIYTQNKTQDKRTQKQRGWVGTYLGQSMLWVNIGQKLVPVGGQEGEDKVRINSEGPPRSLGTVFSQILSSLCLLL